MNDLIDTFANRLSYALAIRNMKPIELAEITKIDKSKISSYMSGRYKAKTDGLKIIADALDVSPVWLMGYDVPMERTPDEFKSIMSLDELYKDTVPLLGTVKAGYDYLANENILEYVPISIKKEDNNYYALKIKRRQYGNNNV